MLRAVAKRPAKGGGAGVIKRSDFKNLQKLIAFRCLNSVTTASKSSKEAAREADIFSQFYGIGDAVDCVKLFMDGLPPFDNIWVECNGQIIFNPDISGGSIWIKGISITEKLLKAKSATKPDDKLTGATLKAGAELALREAKKMVAHYHEWLTNQPNGNLPSGKNATDALAYVMSMYKGGGDDYEEDDVAQQDEGYDDDAAANGVDAGLMVFYVYGPLAPVRNQSHLLMTQGTRDSEGGRAALRKAEADAPGGATSSSGSIVSFTPVQKATVQLDNTATSLRLIQSRQFQLNQRLTSEKELMHSNMEAMKLFKDDPEGEDFVSARAEWKRNKDVIASIQENLNLLDEEIAALATKHDKDVRFIETRFTTPPATKKLKADSETNSA